MENEFRDVASDGDFQEFPPDIECPVGFDIVRAPSKGTFDCVCLSSIAMGKYTHWWHGRTQPCEGVDCPKCLSGSPRRWHSWVAVYNERSGRVFLLEVPAGAAKCLGDFRSKSGTLRGVGIALKRANGKVNGPVRVGFAKPRTNNDLLPACPDVAALLERMWSARPGYDSTLESPALTMVKPDDRESVG
jgi:hypothetical protein